MSQYPSVTHPPLASLSRSMAQLKHLPMKRPRHAISLLQARRTKEILSANNAAPLSVEEFYEGKDFQVRRS